MTFNDTVEIRVPQRDWLFLRQERDQQGGGGFHLHNPWGNSDQWQGAPARNRLEIAYRTSSGKDMWGQVVIHGPTGNIGLGVFEPQARLHVQGDVIVTGDITLQNADLAERFTVSEDDLEPGEVVVLGDDEGVLRRSRVPYDRRVAGVVAGAGCFRPGIVLDERETFQARRSVALIGKAYCRVDADAGGPVRVGDLLTTSERPGHAMRAADPASAFGATIGKALHGLPAGTGLIPVLVALQ